MKEKLKEIIRSVPITDKTYPEYVEAVAERLNEANCYKASKVALEVISEIEDLIKKKYRDNKNSLYDSPIMSLLKYSSRYNYVKLLLDIAELKKTYAEDKNG